jgi:hypothetical protein
MAGLRDPEESMTRFIAIQVIAVLIAVLLPVGNAPLADELIAPSRELGGAVKSQGQLIVFSEPPGLPAALDGRSLGQTPTAIETVDAGTHKLRVEAKETEIAIEPGQTLAISLFKGDFVRIAKTEEAPVQAPKKEAAPAVESRPAPATSGEYQPPALSPIEHHRMFGYY